MYIIYILHIYEEYVIFCICWQTKYIKVFWRPPVNDFNRFGFHS